MSAGRFAPPPAEVVAADVAAALAEDIGSGDATAGLLEDAPDSAYLLCKEDCVLAGRAWFEACHRALDPGVRFDWCCEEGDHVARGSVIAILQGRNRALVSAERASLNFLQTLSGTATATARYVAAVRGTGATILDTRKTIPGLRQAQKYAVRVGGGSNHRIGLFDAVMLKENHIRACSGITEAVKRVKRHNTSYKIEVEVTCLEELEEAVKAGVDRVMLDNMDLAQIKDCVKKFGSQVELEISGGVTASNIRSLARTGVQYISSGALTHSYKSLDISLLFDKE